MYFNWRQFLHDLWISVFAARHPHLRLTGHRARVVVMLVLCMAWMGGSARLGLMADHLLFPWFRRRRVVAPTFIVGNFRSGSTLLHRLLAHSSAFTAMKTWELYFAPSITQRKFWHGVWIVDRWFGGRLRSAIERAQARRLAQVQMHKVRLEEPEEDEALFLYLWDSFFNWFFVPADADRNPYWRFDSRVPAHRRRAAMRFYRGILQRHLALAPPGSIYLSKSPAFTARLGSLIEEFPDARIIELVRHPFDVVPSGAAWFAFAWHYFASPVDRFPFLDTFLSMANEWYLRPERVIAASDHAGTYHRVRYEDLVAHPSATVTGLLHALGIYADAGLRERLARLESASSRRRSHSLSLADLGLSRESIASEMADVFTLLGYDPDHGALPDLDDDDSAESR